jgi:hypothetical protein
MGPMLCPFLSWIAAQRQGAFYIQHTWAQRRAKAPPHIFSVVEREFFQAPPLNEHSSDFFFGLGLGFGVSGSGSCATARTRRAGSGMGVLD